jgi:hypothetical protein
MRMGGGDVRALPWWARAAVALPGLAIGAGIGFAIAPTLGRLSLDDREAGAVTFGLPHGDTEKVSSEAVGKIEIEHAGGFDVDVGVTWQGGTLDDQLVQMVAQGMGGRATLVQRDDFAVGDAIAHRSATLDKGGRPGWITMFTCGPVLASVRCRAEAGATPAALPITFDAPPGWTAQPTEAGQLAWANADLALLVRPTASGDDADVEHMMLTVMPGQVTLGEKRSDTGPDGPRATWSASIKTEGMTMEGVISTWACPGRPLRLMAMVLTMKEGGDTSSAISVLDRVRCARP